MDITGGIGKATCKALARTGARGILVADMNLEGAQETVSESQEVATSPAFRALAVHLDVTVEESVKRAVAYMVDSFGRMDYCIHSAAVSVLRTMPYPGSIPGEVSDANFADFKHLLEVYVQGTFLVTSHALAAMRSQELKRIHPTSPQRGTTRGCLINMASLLSYKALPSMIQYVASKHAVMGISTTAAVENVRHGIRVNCVCPSYVDTAMVRRKADAVPGFEQAILSGIPMGRLATAEEIADMVLSLCSPMSSYMTGCGLVADGGMSLFFGLGR
ncbi:3-oxoacyl-reductase [Hypoxylon cercidicola]|nr:3-oxoacyl-reductase [Hypoxylon cercidicola]